MNIADNAPIGSVRDVILDAETGDISYVLISSDGESAVPVPIADLALNQSGGELVISIDQATFADAPSFALGELPTFLAADWDSDVAAYWTNASAATATP